MLLLKLQTPFGCFQTSVDSTSCRSRRRRSVVTRFCSVTLETWSFVLLSWPAMSTVRQIQFILMVTFLDLKPFLSSLFVHRRAQIIIWVFGSSMCRRGERWWRTPSSFTAPLRRPGAAGRLPVRKTTWRYFVKLPSLLLDYRQ